MKLSNIKLNPNNPRIIKEEKFKQLVASIKDFPKMMELRPIVVDSDYVILGGNMRFRALQEAGYTEIDDSWIKVANKLTEEEKKRFIIEDNMPFGIWDWDKLGNEWSMEELLNWGFDKHDFGIYDESDLKEIWNGMPEFSAEDKSAFKNLIINFENEKDMNDFAQLIGQDLTIKTKSIWFPEHKKEKRDLGYKNES